MEHVHVSPSDFQSKYDWFTNFGRYMRRIDCLHTADGSPDWLWISVIIACTVGVIISYLKIYHFWIKCYFGEQKQYRNPKMLQLANIFLFCAITGYALSIVMFFWPAYRLMGLLLIAVTVISQVFAYDLSALRTALSAVRFKRELEAEQITLKQRNRTLESIYQNVKSAFLLIDHNFEIEDGFTDSCKTIIASDIAAGMKLTDALHMDQRNADNFQVLLGQVFEDMLPEELSVGQLPAKHAVGGRVLQLEPSVVRRDDGSVKYVLFTVFDISRQEKIECENIKNQALLKVLQQKDAFVRFLLDARDLLELCAPAAESQDSPKLRASLHTIKGNAGLFDLTEIVAMIHEIENRSEITLADVREIESTFRAFLVNNFQILKLVYDGELEETYTVPEKQVLQLSHAVRRTQHLPELRAELMDWIKALQLKPAGEFLRPLLTSGENLGNRLGKPVHIAVDHPDAPVDSMALRPILRVVPHLIRNAIDHGIEPGGQRGAKPEKGQIHLDVSMSNATWVVTVRDDGQGIDTEKVVAKALDLGLVSESDARAMTEEQKNALVFHSRLSTADEITDISGRGIGVSAVADAVREMSGSLEVRSQRGQGTTFVLRIPAMEREEHLARSA